MAELLDSVENSVWHAFDYMALEGNGTVTKSKLKVGRQTMLQDVLDMKICRGSTSLDKLSSYLKDDKLQLEMKWQQFASHTYNFLEIYYKGNLIFK